MAIMHPNMYATGQKVVVQLGKWSEEHGRIDILQALQVWPSVYSIASLMVNRSCPVHLDING